MGHSNLHYNFRNRSTISHTNVIRVRILLVLDNRTSVTVKPCMCRDNALSRVELKNTLSGNFQKSERNTFTLNFDIMGG